MYVQIKQLADEAVALQNKVRMDAVLREISALCADAPVGLLPREMMPAVKQYFDTSFPKATGPAPQITDSDVMALLANPMQLIPPGMTVKTCGDVQATELSEVNLEALVGELRESGETIALNPTTMTFKVPTARAKKASAK